MISLILDPSIKRRLAELARGRSISEAELAHELIEASLDEIDEIAMAAGRLENRQPPVSAAAARTALGLDD
jgi:predicted DNA-binding protein